MERGLGNASACGPVRGDVRPMTRSHAAPIVERDGPQSAVGVRPRNVGCNDGKVGCRLTLDGLTRAFYVGATRVEKWREI